MSLFIATFEAVAMLLGIGILGYYIVHKKIVSGNCLNTLNPLVIEIALPSLVFASIILNFNPMEFPNWWTLPLWWVGFTVIAAVLTFAASFVSQKSTRREFAITLFLQSGLFIPLALIPVMFGRETPFLAYLFLFILFYPLLFFNIYPFFFGKKVTKLNWKRIFNSVLIATLVALGIKLAGFQTFLPNFLLSIFQMLGAMAIPLIMLVVGGTIYLDFHEKGSKIHLKEIMKFVLFKNIVFPLVALALLVLIQPTYPVALIILLQAAVPPLNAIPLFTQRGGGNVSIVNQFLVASMVFSLVSIPAMVWLFSRFFMAP